MLPMAILQIHCRRACFEIGVRGNQEVCMKEGGNRSFLKKKEGKQYTWNFGVAKFCIATDAIYIVYLQYQ